MTNQSKPKGSEEPEKGTALLRNASSIRSSGHSSASASASASKIKQRKYSASRRKFSASSRAQRKIARMTCRHINWEKILASSPWLNGSTSLRHLRIHNALT